MRIINPQSAQLSNHEVHLFLQEQDLEYTGLDNQGHKRRKPQGLEHMLKDTLHYFTRSNEAHHLASPLTQHPNRPTTLYKGPNSLFRALAPTYRLNKAEFLQIYNLRPTTAVELQVIIEESHTRFSEEDLEHMIDIIAHVFEEDEADIPAGAENVEMERIPNKLLGAAKKKKKVKRRAG